MTVNIDKIKKTFIIIWNMTSNIHQRNFTFIFVIIWIMLMSSIRIFGLIMKTPGKFVA